MDEILLQAMQLGGTVFVVAIFIYYLIQRNGKTERSFKEVADTLKDVHKSQEQHTRVLIKISEKHGLRDSAEDLIKS